jgi:hypothetical protein
MRETNYRASINSRPTCHVLVEAHTRHAAMTGHQCCVGKLCGSNRMQGQAAMTGQPVLCSHDGGKCCSLEFANRQQTRYLAERICGRVFHVKCSPAHAQRYRWVLTGLTQRTVVTSGFHCHRPICPFI